MDEKEKKNPTLKDATGWETGKFRESNYSGDEKVA